MTSELRKWDPSDDSYDLSRDYKIGCFVEQGGETVDDVKYFERFRGCLRNIDRKYYADEAVRYFLENYDDEDEYDGSIIVLVADTIILGRWLMEVEYQPRGIARPTKGEDE